VVAVLETGSEKAAAHRLGLSHSTVKHHLANARLKTGTATTAQLVWILGSRLPGAEAVAQTDESWVPAGSSTCRAVRAAWLIRQRSQPSLA
jgi:hypothetical protein